MVSEPTKDGVHNACNPHPTSINDRCGSEWPTHTVEKTRNVVVEAKNGYYISK